jgi:hypothetical protein
MTKSGTDGSFAFASVPDGLVVTASTEDDRSRVARLAVTVNDGEKKRVTLTLPEAREALGVRVIDDRGYPLESAQVTAHSLEPSVPLRVTSFTNARGEGAIAGGLGIALRVEVSASGHGSKVVTTTDVQRELVVELGLATSATGEVRTALRREPVAGAEVVLYTDLGTRRGVTAKDGTYLLQGLTPGAGRIRVRARGYAPRLVDVEVLEQSSLRPFVLPRVELVEEGAVEGVVVDGRGEPVQGARVARDHVPTYLAVGATPSGVAVTDAKGRFVLRELNEGLVTLEAYAPELGRGRIADVRVVAGRTTVSVTVTVHKDSEVALELGSTGGVAVTLGETSEPRDVVIVAVAEGSEAERAGLVPGDVVVDIDGTRVGTIEAARRRLSGPVADDVVVRVRRGERVEVFRVGREAVRR